MTPASERQFQRLADEFGSCFADVLGSMTGQQFAAQAALAENLPPDCDWLAYTLSGPATAAVAVGVAPDAMIRIGGTVLTAAGVEIDEDSARSTFAELLSQVVSAWSQTLSKNLAGPLAVDSGKRVAPPPAAECCRLSVWSGEVLAAEIWISPRAEFSLSGRPEQDTLKSVPHGSPTTTPPALDLLMDVELPVSVSFGRAQLPIKEVLKLSSGSIVELARNVSEPVELIVNNCVIARGEVVVIEGNYGVRIEEIISPQERLRTLK